MTDWIWAIADGRRDGYGHDVVDEQGRGGDQPEDRREVRARDDIGAAAVGVRAADLPVRHGHDGEEDRDRDRRPGSTGAWRRRRRRCRTRRISSVAYADELMASELKMARAFFFDRRSPISSSFASGRPKTTWRTRASGPPGRRPRHRGRLSRDQRPGSRIAEVRGVRALDADTAVAGLAALELLAPADHRRAPRQPGMTPHVIEARPDAKADGSGGRAGSLELESDTGGLCLGKAQGGGALRGLEACELDDPGQPETTSSIATSISRSATVERIRLGFRATSSPRLHACLERTRQPQEGTGGGWPICRSTTPQQPCRSVRARAPGSGTRRRVPR